MAEKLFRLKIRYTEHMFKFAGFYPFCRLSILYGSVSCLSNVARKKQSLKSRAATTKLIHKGSTLRYSQNYHTNQGCSEINETLAENKLLKQLQILFIAIM